MDPIYGSALATDLSLFLETSLFFLSKAAPQKNKGGEYGLGALLMPREIAGLVRASPKRKRAALPPNVRDAMNGWLCSGDSKFVATTGALELEKTSCGRKRQLLEMGMATLAKHIPILCPSAPCVTPPISTSDHENEMLYFTRIYGNTMAPMCAHGPDGCVGALLPKAPGPLPIYLTMSEEKAARESEETAKKIFDETGPKSLCILCIRAESNAIACGLSDKLVNSAEELHRTVAIMPPCTNLVGVPGGYFDWAIGVSPEKMPQITFSTIVQGNPVDPNGESALCVYYDRSQDASGRERGLHVNQDAIIWRPHLN
jgi:hypothetical protein